MGSLQKRNWLHCCGRWSAATPPVILVAGTGDWAVARNGAGSWDVTMNVAIDVTERCILVQSRVTSTMASTIPASDTDTVFRVVNELDESTATDAEIDFLVIRNGA